MDGHEVCRAPPGPHLDTVRALHQTVISLRTALESSKCELKELKQRYQQQSRSNNNADIIEKLTLENHILRRKIIDSQGEEAFDLGLSLIDNVNISNIPEVNSAEICDLLEVEEVTTDVTIENNLKDIYDETEHIVNESRYETLENYDKFCSTSDLNEHLHEKDNSTLHQVNPIDSNENINNSEELLVSEQTKGDKKTTYKTKIELLSKFDVSIKVRTLEGDENFVSSTTSETGSTSGFETTKKESATETNKNTYYFGDSFKNEEVNNSIKVKSVSKEGITMAVPGDADSSGKNDKYNVQVRITSEENLVVEQNPEHGKKRDTLNLDVDNLSIRSMSEGDNSVFSEDVEGEGGTVQDEEYRRYDQECGSGNESEEVDDIELIFTTDESKDMSNLQEDLVSIREGEPWVPTASSKSAHSTPVLTKFNTLDPDFQPHGETTDSVENENQENSNLQAFPDSALRIKRVSLPNEKEIKRGFNGKSLDLPDRPGILKSCDNKSDNILNKAGRRLDSMDSLSCEYNRGMSFDNTKSSSFELGSSMDILHREESVDSFQQHKYLRHRFSVFAETDISKCGISEEDLASANLNARRNTLPNPFQYKPVPHRPYGRQSGPFKATAPPCVGRTRPILRADNMSVRRENGAQTEVSALPPRWSSDGYLAHKVGVPRQLATVPSRMPPTIVCDAGAPTRRLSELRPRALAPVPRTDEARRVLLSDIGFTSMVPELSRSADPVWAEAGGATACTTCGSVLRPEPAMSPTCISSGDTNTSRYLARGSYRAQGRSAECGFDMDSCHVPAIAAATRKGIWRSSLPDVRPAVPQEYGDTDELMDQAESYLRRSIDDLHAHTHHLEVDSGAGMALRGLARPYIPAEPRHLRLGHAVKLITPHGRIAIGTVRYVGLAGSSAADSGVMVGSMIECATNPCVPHNDGTHQGRRYFRTPPGYNALFVPFSKVVMAWAN